jgi:perosamine synthetase
MTIKIPLMRPLTGPEELEQVAEVLKSGALTQGPKVKEFESAIADYVSAKEVVALSSATTGLHLAMILAGIKPGDEVIVPSYTFIATANAVLYVGATPVFADIDPKTFNIDPAKLESLLTKKTKAVIAVDQFGLSADHDPIQKFCKENGLQLIEDAACALGAEYKGKKLGSFGELCIFSFHPRKSISTGEGGAIITSDSNWAERARVLRAHGMEKPGSSVYLEMGYNYRLSDIQAAVGVAQMKRLPGIIKRRREIAHEYSEAFKNLSGVVVPHDSKETPHTYQTYTLTIDKGRSEGLIQYLIKNGIASRDGISPIHKQLFMRAYANDLPNTERAFRDSVVLPLFPQMTNAEVKEVIEKVRAFSQK